MPKFEPKDYLPVEQYQEAAETLHAIDAVLLFEFAREKRGIRDTIIGNFIARTDMMARAIFRLWELQDYQDCWILLRCLLDRFFHLWHLQQNDQFELFEAWSRLEQYKAINRVRSDPEFISARESKLFALTAEQKERAGALAKEALSWQRPKPEEVAKSLDMRFLYRFGYDFASMHVHPMANDGEQDFYTTTKLEPTPDFPDQRAILSNTLLVASIVVQHGLNASTLARRTVVFDFLDDLKRFLETGADDYKVSFLKLRAMIGQDMPLCQAAQQS